jgi:hypothetical protein
MNSIPRDQIPVTHIEGLEAGLHIEKFFNVGVVQQ